MSRRLKTAQECKAPRGACKGGTETTTSTAAAAEQMVPVLRKNCCQQMQKLTCIPPVKMYEMIGEYINAVKAQDGTRVRPNDHEGRDGSKMPDADDSGGDCTVRP